MALQRYEGPAEIYVTGRLLAEASSVQTRVNANNNPVRTMRRGLAGKSDGAREATMSISNAIPRAGAEFDFVTLVKSGAFVEVVQRVAGVAWTFEMWIDSCDVRQQTDGEATYDVELFGSAPDIV